MNRTSIARRYLPLAAVVAVQALLIAVVPSTASSGSAVSASGAAGYSLGAGADAASSGPGSGGLAAVGGADSPGGASAAGVVPGTGATASATAGAGGAAGAGDTGHCVQGREFDPGIDYYAPPCTPGTPGGRYPSNGGATAPGVTTDGITIVDYVTNYGAEINTILQAQGNLETATEAQAFDKVVASFINAHYVLYGRKINIVTYQGQCQAAPPDVQCLLPEMDSIVARYHPYAVLWQTSVCSACFAELARDHVVGFGGLGFSDQFANANAPYFYSATESATRVVDAFAQFWCAQLSSVDVPSRKTAFAGTQNPAENLNGQPRRLGVVSTNDPDNQNTVTNVLEPELRKDCGDKVWHTYFYSQDVNTATQQTQAGIAAMNTSQNPATSVLCLCDVVAPQFSYGGSQQDNYYPEPIIASDQGMDADTAGQTYEDNGGNASVACPTPARGCPFDTAFGLSSGGAPEAQNNDAGTRVWHAGGGTGNVPLSGSALATSLWEQYNMMASLIENTGPDLTPARMQAAAPSLGTRGGGASGHYEVGFAPGDWQWIQDTRVVYWDKHTTSVYNGKPGAYVQVEGTRFNLGQFPSLPGGPPIPATR
ncbi:MAG TPA: hypothetical protein VFP54_09080 [Acidimicrobiales bacterium]|nr:hypothetical protein [Acidimicrobiales bacterium]